MKEVPVRGANGPPFPLRVCNPCPREDSHKGEDYHLCRSVHAERQAILLAARRGQCTEGSTLYLYMGVPCKDCMVELVQAGVSEIVILKETYHDELSKSILQEWVRKGGVFRVFEGEV
jgi:deoxycytidylate deaminase